MQSGFSQLGNQKDIQEIIEVINSLVLPQGITAKAEQENGCLYVLLEATTVPEQQKMVALVSLALGSIKDASFTHVKVYGRQSGNPFTDWSHEIALNSKSNPGISGNFVKNRLFQAEKNPDNHVNRVERFLVCGLGSLGQHCVVALKEFALQEFEVHITAIDRHEPETWEFEDFPNLLQTSLMLGDCRRDSALLTAGITHCRAIIIVTSDDNVNIETAIAARRINPNIRVVVRSGKQNLNKLLEQKLGNFVALDPTGLHATTFAVAALGGETLGFFNVADHRLRIVEHQVKSGDYRFENFPVHRLHKRNQRLLSYPKAALLNSFEQTKLKLPEFEAPLRTFHQWTPDIRVQRGDTIVYIEEVEHFATPVQQTKAKSKFIWQQIVQKFQILSKLDWRQGIAYLWNWLYQEQTRRVVTIGLLTGLILGVIGSVVLKFNIPNMSWQAAISDTIILLLGGYGDVFGGVATTLPLPWWAQFICLVITAFSLLFILSILGLIADRIISSRFEFLQRRLPIPESDHVVIVGLGRLGKRIAILLHDLGQPFVCLTQNEQQEFLPQVPIVSGGVAKGLTTANLPSAKSVIMVTDDQMLNLEVALMARDVASNTNRNIDLVIRTYDQRFSDHIAGLLPNVKSFCAYALSAQAFVGAAFGENILSLFRLQDHTVLVTEYQVEANDTLNGKILSEIAYGYGVVPVFYQCKHDEHSRLMPSDDTRLYVGDRLVVLATINGLRRIERGVLAPCRTWQLQALKPLDPKAIHYAGDTLTNISGCSLSEAREFMKNLPSVLGVPGVIELSLYDHQAYRLVHKLRKILPVRLVSVNHSDSNSYKISIDWQEDWVVT